LTVLRSQFKIDAMEIVIAVALSVFIVLAFFIILLIYDLRKTLQEVHRMLHDWNREIEPILKNLNELTTHTTQTVKEAERGIGELLQILRGLSMGMGWLKLDKRLFPFVLGAAGYLWGKIKSKKKGGEES